MNKSANVLEQSKMVECALYLKALADPIRLQIVCALRNGPMTVSELSISLKMELANVSHHLRVLFNARVVTTERNGKYVHYSINNEFINPELCMDSLDFGCCKLDLRLDEDR